MFKRLNVNGYFGPEAWSDDGTVEVSAEENDLIAEAASKGVLVKVDFSSEVVPGDKDYVKINTEVAAALKEHPFVIERAKVAAEQQRLDALPVVEKIKQMRKQQEKDKAADEKAEKEYQASLEKAKN